MKINLYEEKFQEVTDIILIKTYMKRLSEYKINKDNMSGSIFIDLNYYDKNMQENFKTIEIEYAVILKDSIRVEELELNDVSCELVDLKGVNVKYNLVINYENREDSEFEELTNKPEEIKENVKNEENIVEIENSINEKTSEEIINENIKEGLKKEYDEMLDESLANRENLTISATKNESEESFLDFFNKFESKHLSIRKIRMDEEKALEVLNERNIDTKDLEKYYDKENHILTIKSYE